MNQKADSPSDKSRPAVTLLPFSGGLDSTYVPFNLLTKTRDEVLVHHVHLINKEGRHMAEKAACDAIVKRFRKDIRPFHYSESMVDRSAFDSFGSDIFPSVLESGVAAMNFTVKTGRMVDRWTLGLCAEETENLGDNLHSQRPYLFATMSGAVWPNKPPKFFRPKVVSRAEQMKALGAEYTALCWTCRRPATKENGTIAECGECKTCQQMGKAREEIKGQESEAV